MMGALAFIPEYSRQKYLVQVNITDSSAPNQVSSNVPYHDLFDQSTSELLWQSLIQEVNTLYCQVHRISQSSPLFMTIVASAYSLPRYLNAQRTLGMGGLAAKSVENFNTKEMACEVNLGTDFSFHNIFICPVSKETSNPQGNNPMLLKCGHVISKHSLNKMTRGSTKITFKCPTCPQEMSQENGVDQIVF